MSTHVSLRVDEVRCLFLQSETHGEYIDSFFVKNPHPSLSWIHDLGKDRWVKASMTLLDQSDKTKDLNVRHVSITFLACVSVLIQFSSPQGHAQHRKAVTDS